MESGGEWFDVTQHSGEASRKKAIEITIWAVAAREGSPNNETGHRHASRRWQSKRAREERATVLVLAEGMVCCG